MKINWSSRFNNKTTLVALVACIVAFTYQVLGILGITVPISEDTTTQFVSIVFNILATLGVIVDPNTKGIGDPQVDTYQEKDN